MTTTTNTQVNTKFMFIKDKQAKKETKMLCLDAQKKPNYYLGFSISPFHRERQRERERERDEERIGKVFAIAVFEEIYIYIYI
jgi:hypothetical protein